MKNIGADFYIVNEIFLQFHIVGTILKKVFFLKLRLMNYN